jgi:hypothetical protein
VGEGDIAVQNDEETPMTSDKGVVERLTKAQRELLELALHDLSIGGMGNPWPHIGLRQRAGGAKRRVFEAMYRAGLFDGMNRITDKGRAALSPSTNSPEK